MKVDFEVFFGKVVKRSVRLFEHSLLFQSKSSDLSCFFLNWVFGKARVSLNKTPSLRPTLPLSPDLMTFPKLANVRRSVVL